MEQKDTAQNRNEKKSERLDVRVSHKRKQAFTKACHDQGDTPSNAVRRFITSYTRRANFDNFGAAVRSSPLRRILGIRSLIGFAALLMLAYGGFFIRGHVLKANEIRITDKAFEVYDQNKNGLIELGEIAPNDFHLHRVLNIDGQDGITRDEFVTHATMVWSFVDPKTFKIIENKSGSFGQKAITQSYIAAVNNETETYFGDPKQKKYIIVNGEPVEIKGIETIIDNMESIDGVKIGGVKSVGSNYAYYREHGGLPNFTAERLKKYNKKVVQFDLRNPDKLELTVYEQTSHSLVAKSISIHQRSVIWAEGRQTPELVMGMGRENAVLTKDAQSN